MPSPFEIGDGLPYSNLDVVYESPFTDYISFARLTTSNPLTVASEIFDPLSTDCLNAFKASRGLAGGVGAYHQKQTMCWSSIMWAV